MQAHFNSIKSGINSIIRTNQIIRSKYNENDYLYKQLGNGLKYLLVQDKKTDKSSAAFCVNVGSLNDPEEYQGLAHFLEHMVFMGSKPYPGENEYNDFLTKNSGYSNAFTDFSMTNYYFDCSNESFLEAFKMTSRFFIDPLLNESSVDREINAVDSEFKNSLREDSSKIQEILNKESHKDTPFNKFMCGNLLTLKKPGLLEALKKFFDKYYSADIITVVVYSDMSLDLLEDKVDLILSEIPNKNLNMQISTKERVNSNHSEIKDQEDVRNYIKNKKFPYDESNSGMMYKYAGIIDKNRICLEWVFNLSYDQYYKKKPLDFLVGLLSSKGSESFILNLINENLITDGSAYIFNYANSFVKLTIDLDLTDDGFNNYLEVIKRVIYSVEKLKKLPVKKSFFDQMKKMSDISFEYHVEDDICEFVSDCAGKLHAYEPQDSLCGDFIMQEYDEELIKFFFSFIENENLNIYLISDSFEGIFENKEYIESTNIADFTHVTLKTYKDICKNSNMEIDDSNNIDKHFVEIRKEEIYDSKYTLEKIDFKKLNLENFCFKGLEKIDYPMDNPLLPEKFEFITNKEEIKNENSKLPPKLVFENEHYSLHYKQDKAFYQPFIYINGKIYVENLKIKNRHGNTFSLDQVTCYLSLWLTLLDKEIFERNSIAHFAGYYFDFYDNFNYLIMKFSGYNDEKKFADFIKYIFDFFIELHEISKIQNFKTKILTLITESIKLLKNMEYDSASSQAIERFKELSLNFYCKKDKNIRVLEDLKSNVLNDNWEDFNDLITSYLDSTYINWLVQGHISEINAKESVKYLSCKIQNKNLSHSFNLYSNDELINDIHINNLLINKHNHTISKKFNRTHCVGLDLVKFNSGKHYFHSFPSVDSKNKNSAIVSYFLLGKLNDKEKCMALLLQTMLSDEFFDDLRTQQCLGYTCSFYMKKYSKIDSFCCLVESSVKSPEYITNKITKFLLINDPEDQLDDAEYIEDFKKYKNSIIIDLKKKDFILANEVDRNFEEISNREYNFDKFSTWINVIENLTLEEVMKFYHNVFIISPTRVDIGFISHNMLEENKQLLETNLTLSYKEIVKGENEKKEKKNENDEEIEEEEEENEDSEISVETPERVRIEDDNFKFNMETYNFNML